MWKHCNDNTEAIITAKKHIESCHRKVSVKLPETALLFYMHGGVEYAKTKFQTTLISERFPSFLNSRPVYKINGENVCFLSGGWGAPMAADTVETLCELGVKNIITVGMCGVFSESSVIGDIIIPYKAFVEEGVSFHYYEFIESSFPDKQLYKSALDFYEGVKALPIVSTDAVYRQTFYKEELWRKKGAVGVDMETSAIFSISTYLGMKAVSILIASDKHPINEGEDNWKWTITREMRCDLFDKCINFAISI